MTILALLAHTNSQMQEKTTKLEAVSSKLGLTINSDKTKMMGMDSKSNERITSSTNNVTSFTYLGSVIKITGGTD